VPDIDTDDLTADSADAGPRGPVTAASDRFIATVAALDSDALRVPSLCEGWTRAHIVAHVARNADSLTNLLTWAHTGEPTYQYVSQEARDADIETGASRSPEELLDDLRSTVARFAQAVLDLPDDRWSVEIRKGPGGSGEAIPARRVMWARLMEVEVHHVDLAAGYSPSDWPEPFVSRALTETVSGFRRHDTMPPVTLDVDGRVDVIRPGGPTVTGSAPDVLAWLIGRSPGTGLRSYQPLPPVPAWK
jgi:maleylpyruvate isomerase